MPVPIRSVAVAAYTVPTDAPEADGTLDWDATTLVLVRMEAGGQEGIGFGYADRATATLIETTLADVVRDQDALAGNAVHVALARAVRNLGRPGIASMAISALDVALWDLRGKLLGCAVCDLAGRARDGTAVYGSGGFTSYDDGRLARQLGGWAADGLPAVKMKVGRDPARDDQRVRVARDAIGPAVELFVDANGAHDAKTALARAERYARFGVSWFEEPVSSDDLAGLRLLRERGPAGVRIAAGEYGYDPVYFRRLLEGPAVDVLQVDATRCGGITGFLAAAAQAEAAGVPVSAHTAPLIHAQAGAACRNIVNIEYFHDHARIEHLLFDGVVRPVDGRLSPDRSRPGLGVAFKAADAERYRA
ncbi:enolase C-terminal domain-like protein [Azospirillum sp. ST 5-10]|uniref:enolase C-terminal domain-like protein n=1 Tax=unclassified Azospirillum TaxID=2630922 RepID=UPI003F4A698D